MSEEEDLYQRSYLKELKAAKDKIMDSYAEKEVWVSSIWMVVGIVALMADALSGVWPLGSYALLGFSIYWLVALIRALIFLGRERR